MASIGTIILDIMIFLSVYIQVFFFVTFLENKEKIIIRNGETKLLKYPEVTIVVPCWNEEKTVYKTVRSLLDLNYPKEKLNIFLIDDGSTDGTFSTIKRFENYSNIKVFHKENGGKYTALNFGLEQSTTEFFGCLDADSFVYKESLARIMSYFEKDPSIMAVAPSVITLHQCKNFIQKAQKAEYYMGVYFKKMLGFLGAINVTPGPLTIFRKKVFVDLGPYRHGHNTEDMEIAYRMQRNRYKIEHCNDAYVYTNTPSTITKLFKQRLRWIFGFINNTLDYRDVLFKKKYGNFALFTLPVGIVSIFSVSYLLTRSIYSVFNFLYTKFIEWQTVGFHPGLHNLVFDPFFINTQSFFFLVVIIYLLIIFSMVFGRKISEDKWFLSPGMIYYFPVFSIIAPLWFVKAVYHTVLKRKPSWR